MAEEQSNDQEANEQGNTENASSVDQNNQAAAPAAPAEPAKGEEGVKASSIVTLDGEKGKGEEENGNEGNAEDEGKKEAVESAPDAYEDFAIPEHAIFEGEMVDKFKTIAKEMNLSQEQAQKFVDLQVEHGAEFAKGQVNHFHDTVETWQKEIKNDPEFGGSKFPETQNRANRALRNFGSEGFQDLLDKGLGSHPEFIKLLARVDKATSDDNAVDGDGVAKEELSAAEIIYGGNK